jgi:hypothetical protein
MLNLSRGARAGQTAWRASGNVGTDASDVGCDSLNQGVRSVAGEFVRELAMAISDHLFAHIPRRSTDVAKGLAWVKSNHRQCRIRIFFHTNRLSGEPPSTYPRASMVLPSEPGIGRSAVEGRWVEEKDAKHAVVQQIRIQKQSVSRAKLLKGSDAKLPV